MAWYHIGNGIYIGLAADTKPTVGVTVNSIFISTDKPAIHYFNGTSWQTDLPSLSASNAFNGGVQTINSGTGYPIIIRRDTDNPALNVGAGFWLLNSSPTPFMYAAFLGGIAVDGAEAGSENGTIKFQVAENGALVTALHIEGTESILRIGTNQRLRLSNAGLTAQRTFTYPDESGELALAGSPGSTPAHAASHSDGATDEVSVLNLGGYTGATTNFLREDGTFAAPPGASGGISNIADADDTNFVSLTTGDIPIFNTATSDWENKAQSELSVAWTQITGEPDFALSSHDHDGDYAALVHNHDADYSALGHAHSWADITSGTPPKLDDLSAPDDNTALDASTSAHGLLPKLGGGTTNFFRADGAWAEPPGGGGGGGAEELDDLTDVTIVSPTDGQILKYDDGDSQFKNVSPGLEVVGKAVASGDGTATAFEITHGVSGVNATTSYCYVDVSSLALARTWTIDGTKIYIDFATPPPSATDNVIIYWRIIP